MTPIFEQTIAIQRAAADPARSAFVAANAGSGKTRVLTNRVARLLLSGAAPAKILCITFTKAAAAEMAERLFAMLGKWALADDETLTAELNALEGGDAPRPPDALARARRLFARALETPGGLKIQTIHSFAENVLKRFPLEANVPPGFSVLDDGEAARLADMAIDHTALTKAPAAIARLSSRFGAEQTRKLLRASVLSRQGLLKAVDAAGGWDGLAGAAASALGVPPTLTEAAARREQIACLDEALIRRAIHILAQAGKMCQETAHGPMAAFLAANSDADRLGAADAIFLTSTGTPRKRGLIDASVKKLDSGLEPQLLNTQAAYLAAIDQTRAAAALADTLSFYRAAADTLERFSGLKASRASLDYDDLVIAARHLLSDETKSAWVMYKLDRGLDHILLDEAQDTSPGQWDIVEGPLTEFFAGAGAALETRDKRTFFAVGDQKQSIYSFQGADAGLFAAKQEDLGKRIAAADDQFRNFPLTLSFRTTAPVLRFVDALFDDPAARQGLTNDDAMRHGVFREGEAGRVELWPPTPKPEKQEARAWDAPLDARAPSDPARALCTAIAGDIAEQIRTRQMLESAGRPVHAGDYIILVQSRTALFHDMIASLTRAGVAVAGADRLALLQDPAVEDLISYARACLLPTDDLSLAEILKSPFFGLDDAGLFALAFGREGALWEALTDRRTEREDWAQAHEEIAAARAIALRQGAFAFFSHLLENNGRRRLLARLGAPSREPMDELLRLALDYERAHTRSLQGFLHWLTENAGDIKRELDGAGAAARVMTVHGAKGLEANIVYLLDAHRPPNVKNLGPLFEAPAPGGLIAPVLSRKRGEDPAAASAWRENAKERQAEEYRRLLYVAATRARERLIICGLETPRGGAGKALIDQSWRAMCETAFDRLADSESVQTQDHGAWPGQRRILSAPQTKPLADPTAEPAGPNAQDAPPPPAWLTTPAAPEAPPLTLAPSRLADDEEANAEPAAYSPGGPVDPYQRGRAIHRLLELLPALEDDAREEAADQLLTRLAGEANAATRNSWRDEALAVLRDPQFAPAFSPASRAEVALAGRPKGARDGLIVSGQIDRLAVEPDKVLIVDYKTNRPPPACAEDVSPAYLAQMAAYRGLIAEIYPGRAVHSALLWTYEARLMALPDVLLDHAFARNLA